MISNKDKKRENDKGKVVDKQVKNKRKKKRVVTK